MSKAHAIKRARTSTAAQQTRTIKALLAFSLLLFAGMIALILYLKHNQEIAAQEKRLPKMTSYVMDEAHLLRADERTRMADRLRALYQANGPQVVVATIPQVTMGSIAEDAIARARAWRIGHAGRNDGVLILIAEKEAKARIEVGYGLEGVLTDAVSRLIIANRMERHLQARDWTEAARGGVDGVLDVIGNLVVEPNAGPPKAEDSLLWTIFVGAGKAVLIVIFFGSMAIFAIVIVMVLLSILQSILLAIPFVGPRIRASKRWSWLAKPLPIRPAS